MGFTCTVCGETHADETRDIRLGLPQPIFRLDDDERLQQAWVEDDFAVLHGANGDRHFVRGLLELPIPEEDGRFGYGSWIEVSGEDVAALGELWDDDDGWRHGPFSGTIANELSPYFATEGAVYRRPIGARRPFMPVAGGLPRWIDGIADTRCIATRGAAAAVADRASNLYVSTDTGSTWLRPAYGLPQASSVVIA